VPTTEKNLGEIMGNLQWRTLYILLHSGNASSSSTDTDTSMRIYDTLIGLRLGMLFPSWIGIRFLCSGKKKKHCVPRSVHKYAAERRM
jgi:hypothetical protein